MSTYALTSIGRSLSCIPFADSPSSRQAGPLDLIDDNDEVMEEEFDDEVDRSLPGVQSGHYSDKRKAARISVTQVTFSPSGRQWAASSTAGLLIYSLDAQLLFDPYIIKILLFLS